MNSQGKSIVDFSLPAACLVAGLLLTWLSWSVLTRKEEEKFHLVFDAKAELLHQKIDERMKDHGRALFGAKGLFEGYYSAPPTHLDDRWIDRAAEG